MCDIVDLWRLRSAWDSLQRRQRMSRNTNVDAGDDATKTDTSIHARQVWERGALAAMKWKASASAKKSDSCRKELTMRGWIVSLWPSIPSRPSPQDLAYCVRIPTLLRGAGGHELPAALSTAALSAT